MGNLISWGARGVGSLIFISLFICSLFYTVYCCAMPCTHVLSTIKVVLLDCCSRVGGCDCSKSGCQRTWSSVAPVVESFYLRPSANSTAVSGAASPARSPFFIVPSSQSTTRLSPLRPCRVRVRRPASSVLHITDLPWPLLLPSLKHRKLY